MSGGLMSGGRMSGGRLSGGLKSYDRFLCSPLLSQTFLTGFMLQEIMIVTCVENNSRLFQLT